MIIHTRRLSIYPGPETPAHQRKRARFLKPGGSVSDGQGGSRYVGPKPTPLPQTMEELDRELTHLGVKDAVLELDLSERDIRRDGELRADARPRSPRVVLSFTHPVTGPTRIPCDTYDDHKDNIRAIRLALEALRAVDRYGITRRAEQYAGWQALPAKSSAGLNIAAAARVLVAYDPGTRSLDSKGAGVAAERIVASVDVARKALRAAAVATHPDSDGGRTDAFQSVQAARVALAAHFSTTL